MHLRNEVSITIGWYNREVLIPLGNKLSLKRNSLTSRGGLNLILQEFRMGAAIFANGRPIL